MTADFVAACTALLSRQDFMLELTQNQGRVGEVLQEGQKAIRGAGVSPQEKEEIKVQMDLLNTRWESLRHSAMDLQTRWVPSTLLLPSERAHSRRSIRLRWVGFVKI